MRFFYLLATILLVACDEMPKDRDLPPSYGAPNSLSLVMDTTQCPYSIYNYVISDLKKDYQGVSQKLPQFDVHNRYEHMAGQSKEHHLQFYINNLQDSSSEGLKQKVLLSSVCNNCISYPCLEISTDKWARNQTIIVVTLNDLTELVPFYKKNKAKIIDACENQVARSYKMSMSIKNSLSTIYKLSFKDFSVQLNGDQRFKVVTKSDTINWLRKSGDEYEQSIIVWSLPYYPDSIINSNLIWEIKDSITGNRLDQFEGIRNIITEKRIPLRLKRIKLNDIFVLEAMGQWKMINQLGVGGTFISYIIPISKEKGSIYLEGFLYDPGPNELESIRKLKIILKTLEITTNG